MKKLLKVVIIFILFLFAKDVCAQIVQVHTFNPDLTDNLKVLTTGSSQLSKLIQTQILPTHTDKSSIEISENNAEHVTVEMVVVMRAIKRPVIIEATLTNKDNREVVINQVLIGYQCINEVESKEYCYSYNKNTWDMMMKLSSPIDKTYLFFNVIEEISYDNETIFFYENWMKERLKHARNDNFDLTGALSTQ